MKDFETRLARLEAIAEQLRNGEVHIDTATALFEEGMRLSRALESELTSIERRVEIVVNETKDPSTPPETALFPPLKE